MEDVDKEDKKSPFQWCEERSNRATRVPAAASTTLSSARAKPTPAAVAASSASSVPIVRARILEKSASASLLEYFPKDGDISNHACLLMLAESADARRYEVENFPKNGDLSKLEDLYDDLGYAFEELGDAYEAMGNQINPDAARSAYSTGKFARETSFEIYVCNMNRGRAQLDPIKT